MSRPAVADSKALLRGFPPRNEVNLVGVLREQPACNHVPQNKTHVARGVVGVSGEEFDFMARGDVAKALGDLRANTVVRLTGRLQVHKWKTELGAERSKHEVEVLEVEPLWQPKNLRI
jgi:hypothetical protein